MDMATLAALAGNTLVTAAVTDAFDEARHQVARVFGRGKPDRAIERRLTTTRHQLTAIAPAELDAVRAACVRQWETRFVDLLADHPEAASELSALVEQLKTAIAQAGGNVANTVSGVVHGPVLMGRDFGDITIGSQG